MKAILLLSLIFPMLAQAKVTDFNSMIEENQKTQKALYGQVKETVDANREALNQPREATVLSDLNPTNESINSPTNKKSMRFKKEMQHQQASDKQVQERVSHELQSEGLQF